MKRLGWLVLAGWTMAVAAEQGDLSELIKRVRHSDSTEFRYEETRTLELAASPVQSSGYLLSGTDGRLVKLQLQPKRIIMAVVGEQMLYFDAEQKERHSMVISEAGAAAEQISVFRAMLQGQIEALKPRYEFSSEKHGKHWLVKVLPKPEAGDEAPSLEFSGDEDRPRQKILIRLADGESTEYRMEKTAEGKQLDLSIQRLLTEASGE